MIGVVDASVNYRTRQSRLTLVDPGSSLDGMDRTGGMSGSMTVREPRARRRLYTPAERRASGAMRAAGLWCRACWHRCSSSCSWSAWGWCCASWSARFLVSGEGYALANASVVLKTLVLYTIMVTGSIWEKVVFDRWLFAPAFFWEDVFSMLVLALHTAYLAALATGALDARGLMWLALAAYGSYLINAAQFLIKLRAARLDAALPQPLAHGACTP